MSWLVLSLVVLALWAGYPIVGSLAINIHGEKMTMLAEACVFMIIAIYVIGGDVKTELAKVTPRSAGLAIAMALMSGIGLYLQLVAFRKAPEQVGLIALITSLWGVLAIVITTLIIVLLSRPEWVSGAVAMSGLQMIGVAVTTVGLVMANWQPSWTLKVSQFLEDLAASHP